MFKRFINLQWKAFFRSSSFGKSLALKIVMIFFGLYMLGALVFVGAFLYEILRKVFPDQNPMWMLSRYLVYWVFIELFFRYFMQKLPVMDIKPLLSMPVKKSSIAHYILGRSGFSGYNILALCFFIPFGIVLVFNGYPIINVVLWLTSILAIVMCINFTNFIINKSDKALAIIGTIIVLLYGLDYFQFLPVKNFFGPIFHGLYQYPIAVLVPVALAILTYWINFNYLKKKLFLDASLRVKTKEASASDLAWTKRFGDMGTFLQLDLKMIWRNKRPKTQAFISLFMIFYGLIFYSMDAYGITSPMIVFVGLFMTGIFLSNFGQLIPAWDSGYYSMMMSQNIPLRKYLESKVNLISVSIVAMFLLSIPYVYFGWEAIALNFSCALYNLGVNIPMVLFFGSFNKKRIELDTSAFGNMQGASAVQFFVLIPLLCLPMLLFFVSKLLFSFEIALGVLAALGIIGLLLKEPLMKRITELYRKKKYIMIAGFKEKNS
ncbi:DUF5687 family protein [Flagellimonas sp. W118]|uniref:DUF5687 family protein n=1 Tax=Flagellimonas sp. W118 TaxID=3410791 RepID=UPI003BF47069